MVQGRLLVVHKNNQKLIESLTHLNKGGLDIQESANTEEALSRLSKERFHGILIDSELESQNHQFIDQVSQEHPNIVRLLHEHSSDSSSGDENFHYYISASQPKALQVHLRSAMSHSNTIEDKANLQRELQIKNEELNQLNQELEDRVQRRTRELKGRDIILEHMLKVHDMPISLQVISAQIKIIFDLSHLIVYLRVNDKLQAVYSEGYPTASASEDKKTLEEVQSYIADSKDPVQVAYAEARSVLSKDCDVEKLQSAARRYMLSQESTIFVPIIERHKVVGIMEACYNYSHLSREERLIEKINAYGRFYLIAWQDQARKISFNKAEGNINTLLNNLDEVEE